MKTASREARRLPRRLEGNAKVWLRLVAALVLLGATAPVALSSASDTSIEQARAAGAALRSALEAWAFESYWALWDMGTARTRTSLPQQDFTDRMRRGNATPEGGAEIEASAPVFESTKTVIVRARFVVRHTRRGLREAIERPFLLTFEDDAWRVNLWDFVRLASYFPPGYLPTHSPPFPAGPRR